MRHPFFVRSRSASPQSIQLDFTHLHSDFMLITNC